MGKMTKVELEKEIGKVLLMHILKILTLIYVTLKEAFRLNTQLE